MRVSTACLFLLITIGLLGVLCAGKLDDTHTSNSLQPEDPLKPVSVKLLYAESHGISWTDLDYPDRLPPLLARPDADVLGIDYHYRRRTLFYSAGGQIWSMKIHNTAAASSEQYEDLEGVETVPEVVVEDAMGAAAVAVDWIRDHLYWSNPDNRTLWRTNLEGGNRTLVIPDTGKITSQNNLVLDPIEGLLFLAVDGGGFLTADWDGGDLHQTMLRFGDEEPLQGATLAIDSANRRLFLSSQQDFVAHLVSCGYDGSDLVEYDLTDQWWDEFTSLGVFSNQVFWVLHVPGERDSVWKARIDEDNILIWDMEYRPVESPITRVWALKVFHPDLQSHEDIADLNSAFKNTQEHQHSNPDLQTQEEVPEPASVLNSSSRPQQATRLYILMIVFVFVMYFK